MPPTESHLLVLSILEGRHFPKIPGSQLVIEARFDGELMSTDAVDHNPNPDFNMELAWEVDKKGLHVLRIARTPIKVQCFAVDKKTSSKSAVGYVILDLRQAQFEAMRPTWHPILNSKYSLRPELLLNLSLEKDFNDDQLTSKRTTTNLKTQALQKYQGIPNVKYNLTQLQPKLVEERGYYQIGPPEECIENFTLSVTVGFAANLDQLVPSTLRLPSEHRGFFFYYSLLGNDILTDPFQDLALAEFSAERATVKITSSTTILRHFFNQHNGLTIHLCCGEMSLGCADIPLKNIAADINTDFDMRPITLENTYELKTSRHSQMNELPEILKPVIGVIVALKKELEAHEVEPVILNSSIEVTHIPLETSPFNDTKRCLQYPQSPPQKLNKNFDATSTEAQVNRKDDPSHSNDIQLSLVQPFMEKTTQIPRNVNSPDTEGLHKYDLTIDLRMLENRNIPPPFNCIVRYSYPYFGNVAPIQTHPAIEILQGSIAYLRHGSTVFSFATPPAQLQKSFKLCPVTVDVLHCDTHADQDDLIGQAVINIGKLLDQAKVWTVHNTGRTAWKQSTTEVIPVLSVIEKQHVADLHISMVIEDFGKFNSMQKQEIDESHGLSQKNFSAIDDKIAEQIAIELERWKEWQETEFLKQLKDKEAKHLETLTMEWTKRETERELFMKKKLMEYQELEDKLKSAVLNVEKRETNVEIKEAELERMKIDLQAEYNRHVQDIKDATRRVKEDYDHKLDLERNKTIMLQEQRDQLQKHLREIENKLEIKAAELETVKEQKQQPDIKFQSDLKLLTLEKMELERKINALTKSKVHYKQQYGRCLKELGRLKQAMQAEAQIQLQKQQQELEQMKLQLMATEQQQSIEGHQKLLNEIKVDLHRLQKNNDNNAVAKWEAGGVTDDMADNELNDIERTLMSQIEESCLAHLIEEQETLLRTGVYSPNDPIIIELEKQINDITRRRRR